MAALAGYNMISELVLFWHEMSTDKNFSPLRRRAHRESLLNSFQQVAPNFSVENKKNYALGRPSLCPHGLFTLLQIRNANSKVWCANVHKDPRING